jgi:hypothetical protein
LEAALYLAASIVRMIGGGKVSRERLAAKEPAARNNATKKVPFMFVREKRRW